jgi:hypothetical protein
MTGSERRRAKRRFKAEGRFKEVTCSPGVDSFQRAGRLDQSRHRVRTRSRDLRPRPERPPEEPLTRQDPRSSQSPTFSPRPLQASANRVSRRAPPAVRQAAVLTDGLAQATEEPPTPSAGSWSARRKVADMKTTCPPESHTSPAPGTVPEPSLVHDENRRLGAQIAAVQ